MITVDFSRLAIEPGFRVLDMGCGSGRHTCAVSRFKQVVAVGSDIRFKEVAEARERLRFEEEVGTQDGAVWATLVSDILRLPFRDEAFDLVICSEVLEHIPDHRQAVAELVRVLKPGRDLVVSVPRYLPERICWVLSPNYHKANDGHVRIYEKEELVSLLEEAGVRKWADHFAHALHTPYWWLKCLVGPTREDSSLVNLYHRFLVWDIMKGPWLTRFLDQMLNPVLGKSVVLYLRKEKHA
ncbi:MAG: class I SAM-dependent methyltransferase [Deltaproteobacteria bacterium]|mgnify:CR=1 FL=1|nr:class I SAM-dependent methyltransferase [Deltaproteobacteria bacterium]MBW1949572.1 class I SAM-dependent methyltransferase [Deltaproteobacteria bacterium]MBW2009149.1 class I SAM-dependent methyltransferase [Deltaproteobacteria bacterium]MBW2102768.1 class I SAM-dependent methyltransferase [Deltaproteobacteria bacterium]MBW2348796.1 class I SAM-dependent methyltransferase [Deltaproteobacteria bacterium]